MKFIFYCWVGAEMELLWVPVCNRPGAKTPKQQCRIATASLSETPQANACSIICKISNSRRPKVESNLTPDLVCLAESVAEERVAASLHVPDPFRGSSSFIMPRHARMDRELREETSTTHTNKVDWALYTNGVTVECHMIRKGTSRWAEPWRKRTRLNFWLIANSLG